MRGQEEAQHRRVGGWEQGGAEMARTAGQPHGASPRGQQADGTGAHPPHRVHREPLGVTGRAGANKAEPRRVQCGGD